MTRLAFWFLVALPGAAWAIQCVDLSVAELKLMTRSELGEKYCQAETFHVLALGEFGDAARIVQAFPLSEGNERRLGEMETHEQEAARRRALKDRIGLVLRAKGIPPPACDGLTPKWPGTTATQRKKAK